MSMIEWKNARFTVITDGVVRMEYATNGKFCNDPTLFAVRGNEAEAVIESSGEAITIKTKKMTVTYKGFEAFSPENLQINVHTGGINAVWHYNDSPENNLGGTLSTLDGVCGERPLPDGILSTDGFYVLDDSGSAVICDGWIKNRPEEHKTDLYFFAYGKDYKAALRDLAAASGSFELPRRCVFGSWYSRWWKYTADEFVDLVDQYDKNGFPLDIMVMDMDWHYQDWGRNEWEPEAKYGYGHAGQNLGWTGYTWNRTVIPDPKGLIDTLNSRGIKVVLNDHPADGLRDH
ncbi:MAG: alpha-xylosidase, partial [Clostridia bacterium]|nr:alpha-xylosidase [Clostridia bacterium]